FAPCEKRRARGWRLGAQPTYDLRPRRGITRIGQAPLIAFYESIEQRATTLFPRTLTRREIDGTQKPNDIDSGRASGGVVEIIQSPGVLHERELLNVRIAVQAHNRQAFQILAEVVADPRDPRPVDEAEI